RMEKALVASIFRRPRYEVRPFRSTQNLPLRFGREDFSPDFQVTQASPEGEARDFLIEVKYRPSIEQFISVENQRGDKSVFFMARRQWPALYFLLVSDTPEPGPSSL